MSTVHQFGDVPYPVLWQFDILCYQNIAWRCDIGPRELVSAVAKKVRVPRSQVGTVGRSGGERRGSARGGVVFRWTGGRNCFSLPGGGKGGGIGVKISGCRLIF